MLYLIALTGFVQATLNSVDTHVGHELRQVENICSAKVLDQLSEIMAEIASRQPALDHANDEYTPQLTTDFEDVENLGRITIGEQVGKSRYSAIFAIVEHPNLVIKYQANCDNMLTKPHTLLLDFWLGSQAAASGVTARPFVISPAAAIPHGGDSAKTSFRASGTLDWVNCRSRRGVVRYMVMERVGPCLDSLMTHRDLDRGYVSPPEAIRIGIQIISMIADIHNTEVVHGDVHLGNICRDLSDPTKLRFIDFGLGVFTDYESDFDVMGRLEWVQPALTPWQLEGKGFARRDDVYKVLVAMSQLMMGESLIRSLGDAFHAGNEAFLRWKWEGSLFRSATFDPIDALTELTPEHKALIHVKLAQIVNMVLDLDSVTKTIPYMSITENLCDIIAIMKASEERPDECIETGAPVVL